MAYKVKFVDPGKNYRMIKNEIDAVYFDLMERGALINRSELEDFESQLADFVGTKYAVGVNSGYHALFISLLGAGVKPGDEIIVPSHTFVASASAIVNAGAKPVLVDVGHDFNIDVGKIEAAITPKTKGIMPVHLNGFMADMAPIMELAKKHNWIVIEDACQSLGATYEGMGNAGSIGNTGCWSFYPFKILGSYGDGGAITTNDPEIAKMATYFRYNGENRETGEYLYHGHTCLLDNIQAAFLSVKLRHLPDWIKKRQEVAQIYRKGLEELKEVRLPHYDDSRSSHIYQNYVIRVPAHMRDQLNDYLKENGVETLIHWRTPYYKHVRLNLNQTNFPETEAISAESISLPLNVEMEFDEAQYVVDTIKAFFNK